MGPCRADCSVGLRACGAPHPAGLFCSPVWGMRWGALHPGVPLAAATEVLWGGNTEPWGTRPGSEQIRGRKGNYQRLLCNSVFVCSRYHISYGKSLNYCWGCSEDRVLELCMPGSCPPALRDAHTWLCVAPGHSRLMQPLWDRTGPVLLPCTAQHCFP